jgi:coenzyme F420 hydrogenase subunit beta
MIHNVKNLGDVVDWGLCIGCGACYHACDKSNVSLVNIAEQGIRPVFKDKSCAGCTDCLEFCPGYKVDSDLVAREQPEYAQLEDHGFGRALEIWEGHAADPEIRRHASSGGLISALALYAIEREGMEQAVHIASDDEAPWLNRTVASRTREDLLSRTGSRYSPASPCDGLGLIEKGEGRSVFIGKPCDAAAASKLQRMRPELAEKLGLVLTFFCAGTPSTRASTDMLESMNVPREDVKSLNYRGDGWPGGFKATDAAGETRCFKPYPEAWSELARRRPFRCHLCPDGLGRVADLACGDAWEKFEDGKNPGLSIVLVRSERGRRILHGAIEAGYVVLERVDKDSVIQAQVNLLGRRPEIFGRILGMRLLGIPAPKFPGFRLGRDWLGIKAKFKVKTVLGTMRRCAQRGFMKRRPLSPGPNDMPVKTGDTYIYPTEPAERPALAKTGKG